MHIPTCSPLLSLMNTLNTLLVEERPSEVHRVRELLLEQVDFTFSFAHRSSICEAAAYLTGAEVDVVVLGLPLRRSWGRQELHRLTDAAPNTPIVINASLEQHRLVFEALKHGAHDYLLKDRPDPDHLRQVLTHIVEQKWRQQEQYALDDRLRCLIESTPDGMVVMNASGEVLFSNRAAQRLLCLDEEDLFEHACGRALQNLDRSELEIKQPNGSRAIVALNVSTIEWCNEPAYLASFRDVTTNHELENKLAVAHAKNAEQTRLKSLFFSKLSHELREPLTTILGFADTLMQELADEKHREFAAIIKQDGQNLFDTLNAVLQLAQLDEGSLDVSYRMIRASKVIQEVMARLETRASRRNVPIRFQSLIQNAFIRVDVLLFQRVILSILEYFLNTIETGEVIVEVSADASRVQICLLGTGQERPFFYPGSEGGYANGADLLRRQEAENIDLAISHRLVSLMDGTMELEGSSRRGTTAFRVSFPRVAPGLRKEGAQAWLPEPYVALSSHELAAMNKL